MATRRLALFLSIPVLSASLAGTLAFGVADYCKTSTSPALERTGLRLTPGDAAGWARLAGKISGPASHGALETAARLNPHNSAVWMELGLRAEADGDLDRARGDLNRAIEMDRGYLPLWTLANFYVRHGDERYAALLRQALQVAIVGAQDPNPVFDLAWQASGDAAFILDQITLDRIGGHDPAALRLYVPYLMDRERTDAVMAAASGIANDRTMLLTACEFLLIRAHDAEALALWNRMGSSTLDPDRGDVVTNGALATPLALGFDWKFNSAPEHSIEFQGADAGARIELSGRQPETVDLLRQTIPVSAGGRYSLRWQTKATSPARLVWAVTALHSDTPFARVEASATGEAPITIPGNVRFASLILRLERRLGEPRFSGVVGIARIEMRHAQ
jgi:hypothetical protein